MGERKTGGGLERRVVSKKPQLPLLLESPFNRFPMGSSCLSWALPRVSSTELKDGSAPCLHHPSFFFQVGVVKSGEEHELFLGTIPQGLAPLLLQAAFSS